MTRTSLLRGTLIGAALTLTLTLGAATGASAAAPRWAKVSTPSAPNRGVNDLVAYDDATKQLVLFEQELGRTWTWDGATWTPVATPELIARTGAAMAYDAATKQLVLYGGRTNQLGNPAVNETWNWDGAKWTQLSPSFVPPPMELHNLAYDAATSQLVLFGISSFTGHADTWTWDGSTWTHQTPAASPPDRIDAMMGYDPIGKGVLLFGGVSGTTLLGDTWRWTGSNWTQLSPAASPAARALGDLALYRPTNQLLLTAGETANNTLLNDVWTWTGTTWTQVKPASVITPPRFWGGMAYDPDQSEMVLFGGGLQFNPTNETWVYGPLQVQTRSLTRGAVGVPYSQTLQAISGKAPYTWSVSAGALPAGLKLSAAGVLSGTPTAAGTASITLKAVDSSGTPQSATRQLALPINPAPAAGFWAAGGNIVSAFALNATSASSPTARLTGALTGLSGIGGLAFDGVGDLYVTNAAGSSIEEFAGGSNGNVAPIRTIAGPATGLVAPYGVALDGAGRIYVTDEADNAIRIYPPGANGNTPPVQTVRGPITTLSAPWGITIDSAGHIWVANYGNNSITEYAAEANDQAAPLNTIAGPTTGLDQPQGLGQDGAGNLLVANFFGRSVLAFPIAGPYGDVAPKTTFTTAPPSTVSLPQGVDVDTGGRLFVADEELGVLVFPKGATSPATTINGGATGLVGADAVAVAPPLAITTTKLPTAAIGRRYTGRLEAVLGQAPLRWRLVRGRLPRGLHLSRSGRITGTPRRTGRLRFTVGVRDAGSPAQSATQRVTLVVSRAPTIRRVRPARGPARGGRRVTITGSGFSTHRGATTIEFGRIRALDVRCVSHTRCTLRTPPHSRGSVDVAATVNGLASNPSRVARYRYTR